MIHEKHQRKLLSAYFDGELSAEESLRAEQLLENSVGSRREIDEIAELSELVKSLPTVSAPSELLPAILRRAERETLLPPAEESPAVAHPAAARTRGARVWLTAVAGIAATAAAVLVTVQWLPGGSSDAPDAPEAALADRGSALSPVAGESRVALQSADAQASPRNAASAERIPAEEMPALGGRAAGDSVAAGGAGDGKLKSELSPSPAPMEDRVASRRGAARLRHSDGAGPGVGLSAGSLSLDADTLGSVRPGDVLQYFDATETKVTTYVVTVVDVRQALDQMQVLLSRNDIPARVSAAADDEAAAGPPPAKNDKNGRAADGQFDRDSAEQSKSVPESGRLFAVYVETTPDRFTSALRDMLQDEQFARLQPKPPVDETQIEVAEAGRSRRQLFDQEQDQAAPAEKTFGKEKESAAAGDSPAEGKPAPAAPPESQPLAGRKTKPAAEAADKAQLAKKGRETEAESPLANAKRDTTRSFQMQVELAPLPLLAERQRLSDNRAAAPAAAAAPVAPSTTESRPDEGEKRVKDSDDAKRTAGADDAVREAPVRVLFVFRELPRASEPQPE